MRLLIKKAIFLALFVFTLSFVSVWAQRGNNVGLFSLPIALMEKMLEDLGTIGGNQSLSEDERAAIERMETCLTRFSPTGRPELTDFDERAGVYPFSLQDAFMGAHQISGFDERAAELEAFRDPNRLLMWFDQYLESMEGGVRRQTLDDLWRRYFALAEERANASARFERDIAWVVIVVVLVAIVRFDVTKKIVKESRDFAFWMLKKAHEKFVAFVNKAKKKRRRRKRFNAKLSEHVGQTKGTQV